MDEQSMDRWIIELILVSRWPTSSFSPKALFQPKRLTISKLLRVCTRNRSSPSHMDVIYASAHHATYTRLQGAISARHISGPTPAGLSLYIDTAIDFEGQDNRVA